MLKFENIQVAIPSGRSKFHFKLQKIEQFHSLLEQLQSPTASIYKEIRDYQKIPKENTLIITVNAKNIPQNLDYEWEKRIKFLFRSMLDLEKLMWNLSTLGGAYSAMGDFDTKFAETAAKITQHQIHLAKKFGDPALLARCYLYIALAEAQLGRISKAVKLVKAINYWSTNVNNCPMIHRCSQGVYQKIVAIHLFNRPKNLNII